MVAPAPLTEAELRRIRSAVEAGEETLEAIGRRFSLSRKTIVHLIARHGWTNPWIARQRDRGAAATIMRKVRPNSYLANPAKYVAAKRREVEQVDRGLYGPLLDDVQWLRRRGWTINVESGGFRVGNHVIDGAALAQKAARERRLAGAPT